MMPSLHIWCLIGLTLAGQVICQGDAVTGAAAVTGDAQGADAVVTDAPNAVVTAAEGAAAEDFVTPDAQVTDAAQEADPTKAADDVKVTEAAKVEDAVAATVADSDKATEAAAEEKPTAVVPPAGTEAPKEEVVTQEAATEAAASAAAADTVTDSATVAAAPAAEATTEAAAVADSVTVVEQTEGTEGTEAPAVSEKEQVTEAVTEAQQTEDAVTMEGTEGTEAPTVEAVVTTEAPEVPSTAEPEVPTTQEPEVPCEPASSPCCLATVLSDDARHVTQQKGEKEEYLCDEKMADGWYSFKYQDSWAELPTQCIKENHCSTQLGYRVELGGQELPTLRGGEIRATLVTSTTILGKVDCYALGTPVNVHRCDGYYVYKLKGTDRCNTAYCTQLPDENLPYSVLGDPPVTTEPPMPEGPTTEAPLALNTIPYADMKADDHEGVVTVVFDFKDKEMDNEFLEAFDAYFRAALAKKLSEMAPEEEAKDEKEDDKPTDEPKVDTVTIIVREGDSVGNGLNEKAPEEVHVGAKVPNSDTDAIGDGPGARRRRNAAGDDKEEKYDADDVYYMEPTPRATDDGELQVAVVAKNEDGSAVPNEQVLAALKEMEKDGSLQTGTGQAVNNIYAGVPKDLRPSSGRATTDDRPDIWESHMGLFIAVIALCGICLVVIIIGLICIKCRGSGSWEPKKDADKAPIASMEEGKKQKPTNMVIENPLPDEEIMRDEAPMLEKQNPAVSPNGEGGHLKKEENWVVPLDQYTDAQKSKPEVANTKL